MFQASKVNFFGTQEKKCPTKAETLTRHDIRVRAGVSVPAYSMFAEGTTLDRFTIKTSTYL
jgi:hypothetical protein